MKATARIAFPLCLTVLGVWFLSGCIIVPMFGRTIRGKNVAKEVGKVSSRKPIRVGRSTSDDVTRVLGEPHHATSDQRVLAYSWGVENALTIWPLCFGALPIRGERTIVLRFDEAGVLRSYQVLKADDDAIWPQGIYGNPIVPDEVQNDRRAKREAKQELRRVPE